MRLKASSVILAVIGILLIVAAAIVRFVLIPAATQLPTDLDETLHFEGSYTGLNPSAIDDDTAKPFLTKAPVVASRQVKATSDDGDTEIVRRTDKRSIEGVDPKYTPDIPIDYDIDRDSAEAQQAPSGKDDVADASGIVFTLPFDPDKDGDYTFWDPYSQQAQKLTFDGEEKKGSRDTYRYTSTASTAPGKVLSDEVVADLALPKSIDKQKLVTAGLAIPDGTLSSDQEAQLQAVIAALGQLPEDIPLTYTSTSDTTLWADQDLGATVAAANKLVITAQLGGLAQPLAVDFGTFDITSTQDSIKDLSGESKDNAGKLTLVGTVVPIVALVLGVLLVLLAILLAVRAGRRAKDHTGAAPPTGGATAASSA